MTRFQTFLVRLREHANRDCLVSGTHTYTYADLLHAYDQWRTHLHMYGLTSGCVVGLRADYSLSAVAALLALWERRLVAALIPRECDVSGYLHDSHATALLDFMEDGTFQCIPGFHERSHPLLDQLRDSGDSAVVLFTSGSTGRPKAAVQSVERFLYKFDKPGRALRTLAFLLFDHVGGLDTLLYTLSNGGTLVIARRRDPASVLELIEAQSVEVLPASPSFLRLLCKVMCRDHHPLSSLKIITYGAEPMDAPTLARVNELFPNVQISQKYGTTETGSPRTVSRGNDSLWLKIGRSGVDTKVIDGILWIRNQGAMLGYLNAASSVDPQGWYCTGDLVDVDGEWIRFRGRMTDTINVGGEKLSPTEVEQCILQIEFVTDVLVSGEPHALLGQIVAARVVLAETAPDARKAMGHIRAHCRRRLPSYKVPVKIEVAQAGLATDRQKMKRTHIQTESGSGA